MPDRKSVDVALAVSGMDLAPEILAYVEQVVVDEDLHRPAMFAITMVDPRHDIVGRSRLKAGVEVEIGTVGQGADDDRPLLTGEVVAIECEYDQLGTRVVMRGYAKSHRLHRGRRTRIYQDMTDSDIVKKLAGEARLDLGDIESTPEVHRHVSQANVSDWEFLTDRARRVGLDLTVVDDKLQFGKRSPSTDAPSEFAQDATHLRFGSNLETFHGRLSGADQAPDVQVRGWDEDKKQPVMATAGGGTEAAEVDGTNPTELAGYFSAPTFVDVTSPVHSEREAEATAKALAERIGSSFAEAEGIARGSTALRAGVAVRVSGVSEPFNGTYVLTRVRHVLNARGYRSHFTVSGRNDRSLLGLVGGNGNGNGNGNGHGDGLAGTRAPGFVRGLVADIVDPDRLGRVKVKFPWLDDAYSSAWAPVMQLGAGKDSGTMFLPAVDDEVLVGFEHGRVDRPIVIGGLFNMTDKPPNYGQWLDNGSVTGRGIFSRKGHQITFQDSDEIFGINIVAVDTGKETAVSIGLNGKDKKVVVQSEGDVDVDAVGDIILKGAKITVQAQGELVLKGATVKIN
jgi:phage protein D/phage baseplate assembly protein gpV